MAGFEPKRLVSEYDAHTTGLLNSEVSENFGIYTVSV